jgi:hypothetical protein
MKAIAYVGLNKITTPFIYSFMEGLRKHNVQTLCFDGDDIIDTADCHVFWGMRYTKIIDHCVETNTPFICLDHGYTHDRDKLVSINLNNLNGKSHLNVNIFSNDNSRCLKHGWEIKPFRSSLGAYDIVIGQIHSDKSLEGNDVYSWADFKSNELRRNRRLVQFKPHPKEKDGAKDWYTRVSAQPFFGDMDEVLNFANCIHTFSSNSAVHAWLEGVPATAHTPMSMIWEYQHQSPDTRQEWLNKISWRQFTMDELSSGYVWDLHKDRILSSKPLYGAGKPYRYYWY